MENDMFEMKVYSDFFEGKISRDEAVKRLKLAEKEEELEKPSHEPGKYKPEATIDYNDTTNKYWEFWAIDSSGVISFEATIYKTVINARVLGVCCETKDEAETLWERMKLKQKILDRIKELNNDEDAVDWKNGNQMKWHFTFNFELNKISLDYHYTVRVLSKSRYSACKVVIQKVQEEFGDEAIINAFQLKG